MSQNEDKWAMKCVFSWIDANVPLNVYTIHLARSPLYSLCWPE